MKYDNRDQLTIEETKHVLDAIKFAKEMIYKRTLEGSDARSAAKAGLRQLCEQFNFIDW